ncbi:tyrosine-type recombinase/integrase [Metabacillus halosaccharovorans]|uniref:tyrosine-type recombinase/integrase n=1 Tax=Metabacillus halosaccharovorans TaxID=930124 RepID=UPI00203D27A6|nr:site-specific integrase [Metabacillus halosaccharovorans]MCM3444741.1 site-specific integrase [Metabacillus halosaccharovorans]
MKLKIKQRGDKYTCVIDVGINGERKQKRITKASKKEVEAAVLEIKSQLNRGTYTEPSKMLFSELTRMWLEQKEFEIRYSTFKTYKQVLTTSILPELGNLQIAKITYQTLISFVNKMYKSDYTKNYVAKHIAVLKMLFKYAVTHGYLAKSPAKELKKQEDNNTVTAVWTEEEANSFLEVARGYAYYPAFLLALTCGCRRGEILGLSWDAIDFENGFVNIKQTLTGDGKHLEKKAKTKQSIRSIKIPKNVLEDLRVLKQNFDIKKSELKGNFLKYNLVVSSKEGTPVNPRNIGRSMDLIIEKAEVPRITFHSLRHTHATLLLENGASMKVISERLGHSNIKTTMDRYTHVSHTLQDQAADIVGSIFK